MSNTSIITNALGDFNQFVFRDTTDFGSGPAATAANDLFLPSTEKTFGQIDMTAIATDVFRQSDKVDLSSRRPPLFRLDACVELASAATTLETIDFYWWETNNPTAGDGNPTDITGVDGDFTESDALLAQITRIGSLTLHADALSKGKVGFFVPSLRYGGLLVGNRATPSFNSAGNMDETHFVLTAVAYAN